MSIRLQDQVCAYDALQPLQTLGNQYGDTDNRKIR